MKHLNAYANRTAYDADENRASENTVSFIRDENKVIYNPIYIWDGTFADPLVGQILFNAGLIADPTQSTLEELAGITELRYIFEGSEITKFPELQYCTSLVNMEGTFDGCNSLTEAPIIPNSVTDMSNTFSGCISLNWKFIIEAVTPPTINGDTFRDVNVISIKVPAQSVQAYKTAEGWSEFADKIFPIE